MVELLGGGVLGSVLGGVFRLVPEFLKAFDKKNERAHELSMFDRQCKLEEQRGAQKMAEIGAQRDLQVDTSVMSAFNSAIEQQTEMVKAAGAGWVASLSASVRPVVTFWILGLWSFLHAWYCYETWRVGLDPMETFKAMLTPDFAALVSGTLNYWFLDRTLAKRGL
jgi:hypothetical protein